MTKETAKIKVEMLDDYLSHTCQDYGESDHEAMMMAVKALEQESEWISVSKELPTVNEEAYSDRVLIQLKATRFEVTISEGFGVFHITKIASYDENAISSDGRYMDTEGWVLDDGRTLSMDEVIAWMPSPKRLKEESEE